MDKATYLRKKQELSENGTKFKREKFCFKCFRVQENCLCSHIKPFITKARFVILMHPMEAKKEKMGTGRLSLACLQNSELIIGIDFSEDETVNKIIKNQHNHCVVLYPGDKSLNISNDDVSELKSLTTQAQKQLVVFLIDGTWPCAKKMMRLSKNIQIMPRVSFTATHESLFLIKEQPAEYCLSTLESIHFFLNECQRRGLEDLGGVQDGLLDVFKIMINFQINCALNPSLPSYRKRTEGYSNKKERTKSKKWGTNRIVFKG